MHHACLLSKIDQKPSPQTSAQLSGMDPGHHNGVGPSGAGKAQSTKASSIVLMLFLLRHCHAVRVCAHWLKMSTVSYVSCVKHSHPRMFHPPLLLFPHSHFDVHFPTSVAPSPVVPFPRSVSTSSSPMSDSVWSFQVWLFGQLNPGTSYELNNDADNDT